jgi:hypothetical protein
MYMPALLHKYPGYAGISGRQPGYTKYAGLADALVGDITPGIPKYPFVITNIYLYIRLCVAGY